MDDLEKTFDTDNWNNITPIVRDALKNASEMFGACKLSLAKVQNAVIILSDFNLKRFL
jgi:hypothetical protein